MIELYNMSELGGPGPEQGRSVSQPDNSGNSSSENQQNQTENKRKINRYISKINRQGRNNFQRPLRSSTIQSHEFRQEITAKSVHITVDSTNADQETSHVKDEQLPQESRVDVPDSGGEKSGGEEYSGVDRPEGMPVAPPKPEESQDSTQETGEEKEGEAASLSEEFEKFDPKDPVAKRLIEADAVIASEMEKDNLDMDMVARKWAELKNTGVPWADTVQDKKIRKMLEHYGITTEDMDVLNNKAEEIKNGMPAPEVQEENSADGETRNGGDEEDQPLPGPIVEGPQPTPRDLMSEAEEILAQGQVDQSKANEAIGKLQKMLDNLKDRADWIKTHKGTIVLWTLIATVVTYVWLLKTVSGGVMKAGGNK